MKLDRSSRQHLLLHGGLAGHEEILEFEALGREDSAQVFDEEKEALIQIELSKEKDRITRTKEIARLVLDRWRPTKGIAVTVTYTDKYHGELTVKGRVLDVITKGSYLVKWCVPTHRHNQIRRYDPIQKVVKLSLIRQAEEFTPEEEAALHEAFNLGVEKHAVIKVTKTPKVRPVPEVVVRDLAHQLDLPLALWEEPPRHPDAGWIPRLGEEVWYRVIFKGQQRRNRVRPREPEGWYRVIVTRRFPVGRATMVQLSWIEEPRTGRDEPVRSMEREILISEFAGDRLRPGTGAPFTTEQRATTLRFVDHNIPIDIVTMIKEAR